MDAVEIVVGVAIRDLPPREAILTARRLLAGAFEVATSKVTGDQAIDVLALVGGRAAHDEIVLAWREQAREGAP